MIPKKYVIFLFTFLLELLRASQAVDIMLDTDIADLLSIVPTENADEPTISGGAFNDVKDTTSPFGFQRCEGFDAGAGEVHNIKLLEDCFA